jgi:hypothetical protein
MGGVGGEGGWGGVFEYILVVHVCWSTEHGAHRVELGVECGIMM